MRLIDADALEKDVIRYADRKHFYGNIEEENIILKTRQVISVAPTVDAEPVRHGRWIWADDGYLRCGKCTQKAPLTTQYQDEPIQTPTDYCPNCGAKMMDGDTDG